MLGVGGESVSFGLSVVGVGAGVGAGVVAGAGVSLSLSWSPSSESVMAMSAQLTNCSWGPHPKQHPSSSEQPQLLPAQEGWVVHGGGKYQEGTNED